MSRYRIRVILSGVGALAVGLVGYAVVVAAGAARMFPGPADCPSEMSYFHASVSASTQDELSEGYQTLVTRAGVKHLRELPARGENIAATAVALPSSGEQDSVDRLRQIALSNENSLTRDGAVWGFIGSGVSAADELMALQVALPSKSLSCIVVAIIEENRREYESVATTYMKTGEPEQAIERLMMKHPAPHRP